MAQSDPTLSLGPSPARFSLPGPLPDRLLWLSLLALCLFLVMAVYGPALQLPFFSDDFVHIAYMEAHSFSEIWGTIEGVGYYRPLTFALWKLMFPLTGSHSPPLQHGLNLLLHLGNGLLVAWLAGRLWLAGGGSQDVVRRRVWLRRLWLRRFLSATLFLLFPFSYQAVPWVGALPHLLVTFLILAVLSSYILGDFRSRRWWLLSLSCTLLALLAHENGVIVPGLILAYELSRPERRHLAIIGRRVLLWSLPVLVWLPLYFTIPSTAGSHLSPAFQPVWRNTLYALQGMAYPLTWLGGPLARQGANPFLVAALLGLPALAIALFYLWRAAAPRERLQVLFPLAWIILAVLPMILFLDAQYVLSGPRLLLAASAGIAWLWAALLARLLCPGPRLEPDRAALQVTLALLGLCLVLFHSFSFLRARMHEHRLIGQAIDQAVSLTETANAAGRTALFVNFPHWIAPAHTTYPLGTEGVVAFPPHVLPPLLAAVHTGRPAQVRLLQYTDVRPALPYHTSPAGSGTAWADFAAEQSLFIVTDYREDQIRLVPAGGFLASAPAGPPLASFSTPTGEVHLLAASANLQGEAIALKLLWQAPQVPQIDVTVFIHVVNEAGQLLAQADGYPLGGTYPLAAFAPGQQVEDLRLLEEPGEAAALLVGLYRRDSGERLPAFQDGQSLPDNALRLPLLPESAP